MSFPISTWRFLGRIFARDGVFGRVRGSRRQLRALRAAAELRASEKRFRLLFDAAPVAISISRDGVLLYVNEASVTLLGCETKADMIGREVSEFVAQPQLAEVQTRIKRRAQGLEEPLIYRSEARRRDGVTVPLRIEVSSLELHDGAATLAFAFDLRPELAAQAQRNAMLIKARRAALFAERLQEITAALAASHSGAAVAQLIIERSVAALEARAGALSVPVSSANAGEIGSFDLEIVAARGYDSQILEDYERLPLFAASPFPAARGFLESRAIWLENRAQVDREFPAFAAILPETNDHAICVLPLEFEDRTLGILSLSFAQPQEFDADTRAFMLTLAAQCAAALERVRLLEQAQSAARLQRESLALLDTLLDTAPVGFAFFDLQGRYVLVNRALSLINRRPVEEHLGRSATDILPDVGARLEVMIARVIATGQPSGEAEILGVPIGETGEVLHALVAFYPVRGAANKGVNSGANARENSSEILGVGSVVIDISARVDAERDRVQLLGELEIERARFEAILQQMPSGVIIAEAPTGRLVLGNPQVAEIWGQPFTESSDIEHYDEYRGFHFDGRPVQPTEWPLARAIEQGETVRGEEFIVARGDGGQGVVRLNAAPIRDRDGHITAAVVVLDDVTARSKSEAAQRFLAAAGSTLVATLDERECYQQLAELCASGVADWCVVAVPGEDGLLSQIAIAGADAGQKPIADEFQTALRDDPQLPFEVGNALREALRDFAANAPESPASKFQEKAPAAQPINRESLTAENARLIKSDSAEQLEESGSPAHQSRLKRAGLLPSSNPSTAANLSPLATVENINSKSPSAEKPNPTTLPDLLRGGAVFGADAITELGSLSQSAPYRRFIARIGAKSALVMPLQAGERILGLMIWISAASGRIYDDDDRELASEIGRRAALVASGARLFHEAEVARDEAQSANRAKDEFLAVVSHELRTPLTPILGWLELLRAPGADDAIRAQAYEVIERNARAQAQLINDILDVSRITTGKLRLEIKPQELCEIVARAVEMLRPLALPKSIELSFGCAPETEIIAPADAARLQQVVWNLLQNALKFTPNGGEVRVNLSRDDAANRAVLEVADNGAGIEPEFLPFVFDRFRQADSSSTRRAGGLGLGLAIVAHIVEGHEGSVSVRSEGSGKGATFRVELPLETAPPESTTASTAQPGASTEQLSASAKQPSASIAQPSASAAQSSGSATQPLAPRRDLAGLRILVVDDDSDTRAMLQTLLEKNGAFVTAASLAGEALSVWREAQPELLVCDIAMPEMDGCDLRRALQSAGFAAQSVALSAYTAPADVQRALDAGFDAHLAKPVDAEKLLALITELAGAKGA